MLQYIIIQLDDTSTSYCHYSNKAEKPLLISQDDLKKGILFAMKENLMIQYVLPDYELTTEYIEIMESIDNNKIASSESVYADDADVVVLNGWKSGLALKEEKIYVLRTDKKTLFEKYDEIGTAITKCMRLNIVITDIETFTEEDFETYRSILGTLSVKMEELHINGKDVQLNLLTDRIMLDKMNNCNAGWESITLAPDGRFYVCPAFYSTEGYSIGSLAEGLDIKNPKLYRLEYAPICRHCDAYQCKRCVWLNRKMTYEVNTPSHEQCVVAHLERNASRELLHNIRKHKEFLPNIDIKEIKYLDPFNVRQEW